MIEKRKKFWITFGIVAICFVALVVASLKITGLKTVAVEFVTRQENSQLPEGIADDIVGNGKFEYGKSLMFINFNQKTDEIEKNYPFVKVVQIIREFPNLARIRILERVPYFRVQDEENSSKWYILDDEFKVLKVILGDPADEAYADSNFKDSTIELKDVQLSSATQVGEFVNNLENKNKINQIISGVNIVTGAKYYFIDSIEFVVDGEIFTTKIYMKNADVAEGFLITFDGVDNIKLKTATGIDFFCKDEIENYSSQYIFVEKNASGLYQAELMAK